ncbi:MAG: sulfite exporter TauE/SafE family protein [Verrucomicrobium sp.]|nr:sulfite exporter TauE/SafE family protein [Verrucomicrobium sp.]
MTAVDTTASAFAAGLVTSLHCVGMCGPLACAWAAGPRGSAALFLRNTAAYHGAKLISYALVGALAGAMGTLPLRTFQHGPGLLVPWLLVAMFGVVALGLERWIPKPLFLSRPMARVRTWAMQRGAFSRAGLLGLATPLLPCGPLYLMFALAMANGSAAKGAGFAAAFGLGTLPLLLLAQSQLRLLSLRLTPLQMQRLQRGLALCATVVMAWRLRGTFIGAEELSCCH